MAVIVIDDGAIVGEAAVVVEPRLGADEQALERGGAVHLVGRARGLKVIDPDLLGPMHSPSGLGEERWHVAARARRLAVEQRLAARRGRLVVRVLLRSGGRNGELVMVKRGELRRHAVGSAAYVVESRLRADGEAVRRVDPRIEKRSVAL